MMINNYPYGLIFYLEKINPDKENEIPEKNLSKVVKFQNLVAKSCKIRKYSFTKFANFLIIVLRAEIATIFEPKVVAFSALNTMRKFANFVRLHVFSTHCNIFQPSFGILLFLKGSFQECSFFIVTNLKTWPV